VTNCPLPFEHFRDYAINFIFICYCSQSKSRDKIAALLNVAGRMGRVWALVLFNKIATLNLLAKF